MFLKRIDFGFEAGSQFCLSCHVSSIVANLMSEPGRLRCIDLVIYGMKSSFNSQYKNYVVDGD